MKKKSSMFGIDLKGEVSQPVADQIAPKLAGAMRLFAIAAVIGALGVLLHGFAILFK